MTTCEFFIKVKCISMCYIVIKLEGIFPCHEFLQAFSMKYLSDLDTKINRVFPLDNNAICEVSNQWSRK